jgi:hypothetical protein
LAAVAEVVDDIDAERQVELRCSQCGVFGRCADPANAARVGSSCLGQHRLRGIESPTGTAGPFAKGADVIARAAAQFQDTRIRLEAAFGD